MKKTSIESVARTAYGKTLKTPVPWKGEYDAYETPDEIRKANDWPSDENILKMRNDERAAKERSRATTAALAAFRSPEYPEGILPPSKDDPQVIMANMIKNAVLSKQFSGGDYEATVAAVEGFLGYKFERD